MAAFGRLDPARVFATDERFCVDNGIMIADARFMVLEQEYRAKMEVGMCTRRFRSDEALVKW